MYILASSQKMMYRRIVLQLLALSVLYPLEVAKEQRAVFVPQVHAVALAGGEELAVLANAGAGPFSVAERGIALVPNRHKIILVNVALNKTGA